MKIRNGFVSNSSSSSFIIFGNKIDKRWITPELIASKKIYVSCWGRCESGADFFILNQKMFDMIEKYDTIGGTMDFYNVAKVFSESGSIKKDEIEGYTIYVFAMEVDYHSVPEDDIIEFSNRYINLPLAEDPEKLKKEVEKIEDFQKQLEENGLEAYEDSYGKTQLRKRNES